jgi:hypothetical protein
MAKQKGRVENLVSLKDRTTEKQREIASKGGKRSGEVKREKKLMRELYAEFLSKKYEVTIDKKKVTLSGSDLCLEMLPKIVQKADASSVSFFKELDRVQMEDLERNRVTDNELKIIIDDEGSDASKDE